MAQIVADPANTSATPGHTDFYISGLGFSDNNRIRLSVDLQGVTTLDGLAASINSAIGVAASSTSPAAIAFQKSGITAASYFGGQLAFNCPNTPFQVEAGDVMANALMGQLNGTAGLPLASTVQGVTTAAAGAAFAPAGVTVRVTGGGLTSPVDITLSGAANTTSLAIAESHSGEDRRQRAIESCRNYVERCGRRCADLHRWARRRIWRRGQRRYGQFAGPGSFVAGAGGVVDYPSIQGAAYDNTAPANITQSRIAHLEFSFNGGPSIAIPDIDLMGGDAAPPDSRPGADLQRTLNDAFAANPTLQAAGLRHNSVAVRSPSRPITTRTSA